MSKRNTNEQSPQSLAGEHRRIALELIDPSPYQRRKTFDPAGLQEIAESFREHGQINDIVVRPKAQGRYELIAGERRTRSAPLAGWTHINARVVEISDVHAAELVLVEQLQQVQFNPLEEAEGYKALLALEENGVRVYTLEKICQRIGKGATHVRELLALLDVPKDLQDAVVAGTVAKRSAAYVASIPDVQFRQMAAQMVLHPPLKSTPMTVVETETLIKDRFVCSLGGAPFKKDDPELVPLKLDAAGNHVEGGPCSACPKRTGNMPLLVGELAQPGVRGDKASGKSGIGPNLCTSPSCYKRKCEAVAEDVKSKASAAGCAIMDDEEAADLFDEGGELLNNIDYVALSAKPDPTLAYHYNEGKMDSWEKLLKEHAANKVTVWLVKNPVTGKFEKVIKWQDAVRSINAASKEDGGKVVFKAAEDGAGAPAPGARQMPAATDEVESKPQPTGESLPGTFSVRVRRLRELRLAVRGRLDGDRTDRLAVIRMLLEQLLGGVDRAETRDLIMGLGKPGGDWKRALALTNEPDTHLLGIFTLVFAEMLADPATPADAWEKWLPVKLEMERSGKQSDAASKKGARERLMAAQRKRWEKIKKAAKGGKKAPKRK